MSEESWIQNFTVLCGFARVTHSAGIEIQNSFMYIQGKWIYEIRGRNDCLPGLISKGKQGFLKSHEWLLWKERTVRARYCQLNSSFLKWFDSEIRFSDTVSNFIIFFCWGTKSIWLCYLVWTKFELILLFEQFELLTNLVQSQREVLFCSQPLSGSSWHWWSLCIRNGFLKFSSWCSNSFQVLGSFSGNCIIHPIFQLEMWS